MSEYTTNDAVEFALTAKPLEFNDAIQQLLADKLIDAYTAKKEEIGQSLFSNDE